MPDLSSSAHLIIILAGMIFSAGVTWGVMSSKQKSSEDKQKTSDHKIDDVVRDLKNVVHKLEGLSTDYQVMKAASARFDKDIEDHSERIGALEIALAKIGRASRRKS